LLSRAVQRNQTLWLRETPLLSWQVDRDDLDRATECAKIHVRMPWAARFGGGVIWMFRTRTPELHQLPAYGGILFPGGSGM